MRRRRSAAIVLRRWPYSETSLALHVLTPEAGVVSLLAKGVNRATSGSLGVLDTWALVDLEFGGPDGAEMLNLYRAELLDRMPGISRDADQLAAAGLVAEIAELAAPPGPAAHSAFEYLLRRLKELDHGVEVGPFVCQALLEGLDLLGLGPMLGTAVSGASPGGRAANRKVWFAPAAGGAMPVAEAAHHADARRISGATLAWLRELRESRGSKEVAAEPPADNVVREALTILGEFLNYHLERPPKAWSLLRARLGPAQPVR